jgi:outer membrane immunogenic protein
MQRTVLGGLAASALLIAASLSAVNAADIPVKALVYKVPPASVAVYSWTGFYVGGEVGVGWMNAPTYTFADPGNAALNSCGPCFDRYNSQTLSGSSATAPLGGIHLGYDTQVAPTWLVGVVGDFTWTHINQSVNSPLTSLGVPAVLGSNLSFQTDVKWLASIRARGGFIMQSNWLIYATGGIAWADTNFAANATCPFGVGDCFFLGTTAPFALNTTRTGLVFGGGLEWHTPADPWRINLEYLIYGFDRTDSGSSLFNSANSVFPGPTACVVTPTCSANYSFGKLTIQTIRVGLSYAFH